MENNLESISTKLRHSKLGITSFVIFLTILIPICLPFFPYLGIDIFKLIGLELSIGQAGIVADILIRWILIAPVCSLILSIIDLSKPNRLKLLPKMTVIIICVLFGLGLVFVIFNVINDISRIMS